MIVKYYYGHGFNTGLPPFRTMGCSGFAEAPVIPTKDATVKLAVRDYDIDHLTESKALTTRLALKFEVEGSVVFRVTNIEYDYTEGGEIHITLVEDGS